MTKDKPLIDLVSRMEEGDKIKFKPWDITFVKESSNSLHGSQILIPHESQLQISSKDWQILHPYKRYLKIGKTQASYPHGQFEDIYSIVGDLEYRFLLEDFEDQIEKLSGSIQGSDYKTFDTYKNKFLD
jgi:hypothetical protein